MKSYQRPPGTVGAVAMCLLATALGIDAAALRTEDIEWKNGDVTLSGTLYLPDGEGAYPAFIFLHGSGPETRTAFTMTRYARQFADHGIAMLLYDKRGTGKSTGDWLESTYGDLATDAARGIELLASRADIDAGTIGVIGASEGGWTGPLTANGSPHTRLLILISAPPMSPFEQGMYELGVELRAKGGTDDDVARAVEFERLRGRVRRANSGWEELDRAIAAAQSERWYELAGRPGRGDRTDPRLRWYLRNMDYDPVPALKQLTIPVLMMYGARDPLVDARTSAEVMRGLRESLGKDFTIHVYPESGHNLMLNEVKFPEDHWDRIFSWIESRR